MELVCFNLKKQLNAESLACARNGGKLFFLGLRKNMIKTLLNYKILEQLGESMQADVYKASVMGAVNNSNSQVLLIKLIKPHFCSLELGYYLQQQIEQLNELELTDVIIPILHNPNSETICLTQPWVSGFTLTQWIKKKKQLSVDETLKIIIALAGQLDMRHKAGHIHKSVKPNNILLNPDLSSVQLIDDVRIIDINQISHFIYLDNFRVQTLPYLSPEQTGRIKHSVNYSTDLYSLGMILFECLTGKPPFLFDDPIAIIHSHLAEVPSLVQSINHDIPEILGKITAELLDKAPEKRYQTASGLMFDLKHCLKDWDDHKHISRFALKQHDFSNRITIPSLMVGREQEKKQLLEEHQKSCTGLFRAALISGLSGIGKTRLIQELQLPIVAHKGYFTSGKFDQFKKHIPYSTLIQALSSLVRVFLTENQQRVEYWKKRISRALGENAKLMTDLVPDLELIIDKQTDVVDLPPIEARNRFNDVAGKFIACLSSEEHPLTLFIDDLQWCDGATFDLLQRLFDNALEYPYLFWIGAYRHNEVDQSHRLSYLINKVKTAKRPLVEIRLNALKKTDVNQMTAYILNTYPSRTTELSNIIYQTSAGNPLFVNESLRWLHSYRHLHLADDGVWAWDDEQLRHTKIPETALDLFKDKIAKQSDEIRELLGVSACLGARFDAKELALVMDLTLPVLFQKLSDAFAKNILLREKEQVFFFHDQVQAAAESFLDEETKQHVHKKIATAYINAIPEQAEIELLPNLFSIVEHLQLGREPCQPNESKKQEAEFNYHAGIAAMNALAMDNANFFFNQSLQLFPVHSWKQSYDFLFSLHKYLARTEMALGNQPASEQILKTLIRESKNNLDRVDCLYAQTTGLSSMGKFKQAIELGNRGLSFFNREIPEDDELALKQSAEILEQIHSNGKDIWQQILDISPSGDRETKIETGIYSELIPDYYLAGMVPQLYLSAIQSTQNCLTGGVNETVIYGFSMVGLYLQRKGQYEMSFNYEDLGLTLAERYPDTFGATKGINGILWTNMHNRRDSEAIIEQCQKNIHRGKNCGDLYNAGLSYGPYIWHLVNQGQDLNKVLDVANECIAFSEKFNLSLSLGLAQSAVAGWSDLMLTGVETYTDKQITKKLQLWEDNKHVVSIGGYYTLKGIAHHYLGNYSIAAESLHLAEPYLRGLSDNILNRLWYVFRFITSLRLNKKMSDEEQLILQECLERVQTWSSLGPILKPYYTLMLMEQAMHLGDFSESRRYAFDAIDLAVNNKFTLLEGFLHERVGQLFIKQQHEHANYHLNRAVTLYHKCAAKVKVKQLCEQFSLSVDSKADLTEQPLATILDVNYLQLATRNITQQLDFNLLLSTILQAVMERLGAKTAYLLIANKQQLEVVARGDKQDIVEVTIKQTNEISVDSLSMAIVNYVYRTAEMLVIDNASEEGDFIADPSVQQQQLKSILCFPLLLKQQVLGVLYLENNLIPAVFTREQQEMTKLLTAQAAVALQNTLLVNNMKQHQKEIELLNKSLEQRVEARTSELNRVNEELNNFAYIVSHDLKAPLRAINQLSGWIAEDYADSFDEDGKEQMALIRGRAKRMHEMIDGILQYSRIGRIKEEVENVDIKLLIKEVIQLISLPKHITINIKDNFPVIKGEKIRIHQVFQNLIDNAIKYNDKETGVIELCCIEHSDDWQISISDNGPGIAKKYQEKIFQLFQTLKPKDQLESTGVGLSLIEKIVINWGGKIWIESDEGKGCQFFFTIPKIISKEKPM